VSHDFVFRVEDVFHLTGRPSPVVTGFLDSGVVGSGDEVIVVSPDGLVSETGTVLFVEFHRGPQGQYGLMIGGVSESVLVPGATMHAPDVSNSASLGGNATVVQL